MRDSCFLVTLRVLVLPSSFKPLPFLHYLACFLDTYSTLTLNCLYSKQRLLPMLLQKAFNPDRDLLLPSQHPKFTLQYLNTPLSLPFHCPLLRLKCCLYLLDMPGQHEDLLCISVNNVLQLFLKFISKEPFIASSLYPDLIWFQSSPLDSEQVSTVISFYQPLPALLFSQTISRKTIYVYLVLCMCVQYTHTTKTHTHILYITIVFRP